jgi:predicted phosphodiesterase
MGGDDMAGVQPFDHGLALEQNEPLQTVLREARHRYVVTGHTHRPMVRVIEPITILNAGTLLTGQDPCCAIVDFGARRIEHFAVDDAGGVAASGQAEI